MAHSNPGSPNARIISISLGICLGRSVSTSHSNLLLMARLLLLQFVSNIRPTNILTVCDFFLLLVSLLHISPHCIVLCAVFLVLRLLNHKYIMKMIIVCHILVFTDMFIEFNYSCELQLITLLQNNKLLFWYKVNVLK